VIPWLAAFARDQLSAFAMMLCVVVADRASRDGVTHRAPYAIAIAAGATFATLAGLLFAPRGIGLPYLAYVQFESLILGGAAVFIYLDRRRARNALARMHAAHLARVEASKQTLESKLQALQARVEPRFLFDTLARVRQLYEQDAARAENMLDELITYLRAAMPRMRDPSSTVGQEIDLARAFLSIARIGTGERLRFAFDVRNEALDVRLPPMILLPLVEHAALPPLDSAPAARSVRVEIAPEAGRLQVRVVTDSGPSVVDRRIGEIRERLAALYDDRASLAIRGSATVLDLPLELVERAGRGR
jgi:hypothetical protein